MTPNALHNAKLRKFASMMLAFLCGRLNSTSSIVWLLALDDACFWCNAFFIWLNRSRNRFTFSDDRSGCAAFVKIGIPTGGHNRANKSWRWWFQDRKRSFQDSKRDLHDRRRNFQGRKWDFQDRKRDFQVTRRHHNANRIFVENWRKNDKN